jgi:hypothetical protein
MQVVNERAGLIEYYYWLWMSEGGWWLSLGIKRCCMYLFGRVHLQIRCISQDLPEVVSWVEFVLGDVKGRVEVVGHGFFFFFTEQLVRGVDVYLFRWLFHDWFDEYSMRILRNLIPALTFGARIVIGEVCLTGPGDVPNLLEREMRYF